MKREQKETTVESLRVMLSKVASLVVAEFRGLKVEAVNGLRREIRKNDCTYLVVKNTLFKRAIAGTAMEGMTKFFKGPTAIAFSRNDPVAAAKVMDKFCSTQEKLKVKGGFLDGKVLDSAGIKTLATMKGKDELRGELLATFIAPAQGFVRQLIAPVQNFAYLLSARERALGETK